MSKYPVARVPLAALKSYRRYFAVNISDHWYAKDPAARRRCGIRYVNVR